MDELKKPEAEVIELLRQAAKDVYNPDPEKYCLKSRPVNKKMLGGPKYLCKMPKGHEGPCFQVQTWSPYC